MSIELMKKLEDLKQTSNLHYEELSKKVAQKKAQYIKDVVNDFSRFFQEKGFSITSRTGESVATYGNLKATLKHEDPSTNYMGVQFRFDLDLSTLNKSEISVFLNRTEPGFSVSSVSSYRTEEDKLKIDISRMEKELEEVKLRLENFNDENWSLFIKNDNPNRGNQFSEPYSSMYELLNHLIK